MYCYLYFFVFVHICNCIFHICFAVQAVYIGRVVLIINSYSVTPRVEQPTPVASSRVESSHRTLIENWTISQLWPGIKLSIIRGWYIVQTLKSSHPCLPAWSVIGNVKISQNHLQNLSIFSPKLITSDVL